MKKCSKCGASVSSISSLCGSCSKQMYADAQSSSQKTVTSYSEGLLMHQNKVLSYPRLSVLLFVLAGLSLLGGIILCVQLWPGDAGYGMEWKAVAYISGITALTVGLVQFALYTAIGLGLAYLKQIMINTGNKSS